MLVIGCESHLDHGLTVEQLQHVLARYKEAKAFFIETIDLPIGLGEVPCSLYGPIMGDEPVNEDDVIYDYRGVRPHKSRLLNQPVRPSRKITVIAGPHEGQPCFLYSTFGGPLAPKEPGDPTFQQETVAKQAEAIKFWTQHALAR